VDLQFASGVHDEFVCCGGCYHLASWVGYVWFPLESCTVIGMAGGNTAVTVTTNPAVMGTKSAVKVLQRGWGRLFVVIPWIPKTEEHTVRRFR